MSLRSFRLAGWAALSLAIASGCSSDGTPETQQPPYPSADAAAEVGHADGSSRDASGDRTSADGSSEASNEDASSRDDVETPDVGSNDAGGSSDGARGDETADGSSVESGAPESGVPESGPLESGAPESGPPNDASAPIDAAIDSSVGSDVSQDASVEANDASVPVDASAPDAPNPCGPCDRPPTSCHASLGQCVLGKCEYTFVEGASCDDGNPCTVDDACTNGACTGLPRICNNPPAPVCISTGELRTYDKPGVCTGGLCVYTKRTVDCGAGQCVDDACRTDPCAGVVCNSPPSGCYKATGNCSAGSCTYAFDDGVACNDGNACTDGDQCNSGVCKGAPKSCASPPADSCQDAYTAKVYDRLGACSGGNCSYTYRFLTCASGCTDGKCNNAGWTTMMSNSNRRLRAAWGSSATSVWAVGEAGTALYFDGGVWQPRATPPEVQIAELISIHGTAANNVFAIGYTTSNGRSPLMRFDGNSWQFVTLIPMGSDFETPVCVFTYGDNDVFVWGHSYPTGVPTGVYGSLYRVTNGVVTLLGNAPVVNWYSLQRCGIQVFSPTDVVVTSFPPQRFNGTSFSTLGGTSGSMIRGDALWASGTDSIFVSTTTNPAVTRWNGSSWDFLNHGSNGNLFALFGSASNRVFAAGNTPTVGKVLRWDGLGWNVEPIPSGTLSLYGVWAAPTGEVFAVGTQDTIIRGP
jgi:hypothetical protein